MKQDVVVIGAGLVGSLLGIYLSKRGYHVTIYERRGDMRKEEVEAGRSINLALSDRGIKALKEVGIADKILEISIPMHGRQIHGLDGTLSFQPYGKKGQYIHSVSRRELNIRLMNLAEQHGVTFLFDQKLEAINFNEKTLTLRDGNTTLTVSYTRLFGADGAYSATRLAHMLAHQKFEYSQHYINCAYKELSIPAGQGGNFSIEKNALHIWPRKDYMLIALPNPDGSFTGTLFFPFEGSGMFDQLKTAADVYHFFEKNFNDVVSLIPNIADQFFTNPGSALVTVKCFPWVRDDHFCLIGDAAHAIVPFFGQGMNAGFEDCSVLNNLMDMYNEDWQMIFSHFQSSRKQDTDAIADLAVGNFIEMQSRTADPLFLLQKKIEARLHEQHPDKWIPAYAQVTFSPHIRYSDALKNSQLQEAIMQEIMRMDDIAHTWDSPEVESAILQKLAAQS